MLDFNLPRFSAFFTEHGIDIDDAKFSVEGDSKAKRLRCSFACGPATTPQGVECQGA